MDPTASPESLFEEQVLEELTKRGLEVDAQVGVAGYRIDLAIKDPEQPGKYLLGIECDGWTYHSAKTARDRDRLRQAVLEERGWRLHRIWSRDWFRSPDTEVEKILRLVEKLRREKPLTHGNTNRARGKGFDGLRERQPALSEEKQAQRSSEKQSPKGPGDRREVQRTSAGAASSEIASKGAGMALIEDYRPARLAPQGAPESFYSSPVSLLAELVTEIVEKEGPVHLEVVARRLAEAWGMQRVGNRIERRVRDAVRAAQRRELITRDGEFLRRPGAKRVKIRRSTPDHPRAVEHIDLEEIAAAARLCLQEAVGIREEELITETARLLGFQRVGIRVKVRVSKAIDRLCARNEAVKSGDMVRLSG